MLNKALIAACAFSIGLVTATQAATIFDTTTLTSWGNTGDFGGVQTYGQSFVAPISGPSLAKVSLVMSTGSLTDPDSAVIYLTPDDGFNAPDFGSVIELDQVLGSGFSTTSSYELITITLGTPELLTGSAQYWILVDTGNSQIAWATVDLDPNVSSGTSLGANPSYFFDGGSSYLMCYGDQPCDGSQVFQMKLEDTQAPEPMTLTILGSSLVGLGLASRWRRRKAA